MMHQTPLPRITVIAQGKSVVERTSTGEILVMAPDGTVYEARTAAEAQRRLDRWARHHLGHGLKIGVMEIDWRGIAPPEEVQHEDGRAANEA